MSLSERYRDPSLPASFGGTEALYHALKKTKKRKDIKKWLETKDSYTLHKPVRKKFNKRRTIVGKMNQQFQADLVDMRMLSQYNNNYNYILTCIDVLSKYAWAIPIKDKKAQTVISAFKIIFSERIPNLLQTDAGKEFINKSFQNYLKSSKIGFFTTQNDTKSSIVERFNRSLKTKMWKYFTEFNTKRYIDVIDKLVYSYNHTYHRSIGMEPISVNEGNESIVWSSLYGKQIKKKKRMHSELKVGDTVRISKVKLRFEKGYEQNWTREIFTILEILPTNPIVYKLKDLAGESLLGTFYKEELQKVTDSGYYPIEKILKTRQKNGRKEYFVKFQDYPEKFNMWVQNVKML